MRERDSDRSSNTRGTGRGECDRAVRKNYSIVYVHEEFVRTIDDGRLMGASLAVRDLFDLTGGDARFAYDAAPFRDLTFEKRRKRARRET